MIIFIFCNFEYNTKHILKRIVDGKAFVSCNSVKYIYLGNILVKVCSEKKKHIYIYI